MMDKLSFCRRAASLLLVLAVSGCGAGIGGLGTLGSLGTIAELLGASSTDEPEPEHVEIVAEVRSVDMDRQVIQVATPEGRAGGVTYDLATDVLHGRQPYPIADLEAGDVVRLRLRQAGPNTLYASRIDVLRPAGPDRAAADTAAAGPPAPPDPAADTTTPRPPVPPVPPVNPAPPADPADTAGEATVRRLEGRVVRIDRERGAFRLEVADDEAIIMITLPYNPPGAVQQRFDRLRNGEVVRIEGEPLGPGRVEILRFLPSTTDRPDEREDVRE
jgi:hypothetical protein